MLNLPRWKDGVPLAREECAYGPCFSPPIPNTLMNVAATISGKVELSLHDAVAQNTGFAEIEKLLDITRPDAVVTTILKPSLSFEKQIAQLCADRGIKCIAIPAPIGYFEEVVASGPFLFAVRNEPEKTILDWIEGTPLESLRGAVYLADGQTIVNEKQSPFFHKLQSFDWSLLPDLRKYGWRLYQVSRNCKWSCRFCVWGYDPPAFKPVPEVIRDLRHISESSKGNIGLLSASITQNRKWFEEFIEAVTPLRIKYATDIRADEVTRDMLVALKRSGCDRVLIGVESFSADILKRMNKKESVEDNVRVIRWCNEIGITTDAPLIFNVGETSADVDEYVSRVHECRPTRSIPVVYKYLKGTDPLDGLEMKEHIFWGTDPYLTPTGLDEALKSIESFKSRTSGLRLALPFWYIMHPSLWGVFAEEILLKIKTGLSRLLPRKPRV